MMASTLADNSSRTLPASGRKREQEIRLFASTRRYDCKRLQVGLAPGVQNLIGCRLAQYVADRRQQRIGDRRIMFGLDMGLDMARGDAFDRGFQHVELVDVLREGEDRGR